MKIYQIEISNLCNLTCSYCPHVHQKREKGFMSFDMFQKTLRLVKQCGQKKIFLHNFGEPLLHPQLEMFIAYSVAHGFIPDFFTNGILLDIEKLKSLFQAGLRNISISEHRYGEADRIRRLIADAGMSLTITNIFHFESERHDWSGQVGTKSPSINPNGPCLFERENAAVILWDGRLNTCCIALESHHDLHIDDILTKGASYSFQPIPLCHSCDLMKSDDILD